jgi:hypothetical protein
MSILDPENLLQEKVFLTIDVKGGDGVNWVVVPESSRSVGEMSYRALVKFKSIDIFVLIEEGERDHSEMQSKNLVKFLPTAIEITLTVNDDNEHESKFIEFIRERFAPFILERNQILSDLTNYEVTQHRFVEFLYSKGLNKTKQELFTYLDNNGFKITQEKEYYLTE